MKKILYNSFFLFFAANLQAQQISPFVVNTTGFSGSTPTVQLQYSIGEIAITKIAGANNSITQGFLQPKNPFSGLSEEATNQQFQVFPNPSQDFISILSNNSLIDHKIQILDAQGREVISQKVDKDQISVTDLFSGLYHVRLLNKQGVVVHNQTITKL